MCGEFSALPDVDHSGTVARNLTGGSVAGYNEL